MPSAKILPIVPIMPFTAKKKKVFISGTHIVFSRVSSVSVNLKQEFLSLSLSSVILGFFCFVLFFLFCFVLFFFRI